MLAFLKKVFGTVKEETKVSDIYAALGYSKEVELRLIAVSQGRALENYAHMTAGEGKFKDRIND